jgi:hypothetical protein
MNTSYLSRMMNTSYLSGMMNISYQGRMMNTSYLSRMRNISYLSRIMNTSYLSGIMNTSYLSRMRNTSYLSGIMNTSYLSGMLRGVVSASMFSLSCTKLSLIRPKSPSLLQNKIYYLIIFSIFLLKYLDGASKGTMISLNHVYKYQALSN